MISATIKRAAWAAAFGALWTAALPAAAETFPAGTVRLVFGLSPGSSSDVVARIVADKLGEKWGKGVIVDNRAGAGGNIAADIVAKAAPDGYTLLLSNVAIAIAPSYYRKLSYDPIKDLVPVTELMLAPHVLCVNPALPIRSVKDLVASARKSPGELTFSSAGIGQTDHMATELFANMAGIRMTHVPYKGGLQALHAVMVGEVAMDFPGLAVALPLLKAGKVRCLAVTTAKRSSAVPDLPTLDEEGIKGYEHSLWNGIFAPARTPAAIVAKVSRDFAEVLRRPDVVKRLADLGVEPVGSPPEEFSAFFRAEVAKWANVIKRTGLTAD